MAEAGAAGKPVPAVRRLRHQPTAVMHEAAEQRQADRHVEAEAALGVHRLPRLPARREAARQGQAPEPPPLDPHPQPLRFGGKREVEAEGPEALADQAGPLVRPHPAPEAPPAEAAGPVLAIRRRRDLHLHRHRVSGRREAEQPRDPAPRDRFRALHRGTAEEAERAPRRVHAANGGRQDAESAIAEGGDHERLPPAALDVDAGGDAVGPELRLHGGEVEMAHARPRPGLRPRAGRQGAQHRQRRQGRHRRPVAPPATSTQRARTGAPSVSTPSAATSMPPVSPPRRESSRNPKPNAGVHGASERTQPRRTGSPASSRPRCAAGSSSPARNTALRRTAKRSGSRSRSGVSQSDRKRVPRPGIARRTVSPQPGLSCQRPSRKTRTGCPT